VRRNFYRGDARGLSRNQGTMYRLALSSTSTRKKMASGNRKPARAAKRAGRTRHVAGVRATSDRRERVARTMRDAAPTGGRRIRLAESNPAEVKLLQLVQRQAEEDTLSKIVT